MLEGTLARLLKGRCCAECQIRLDLHCGQCLKFWGVQGRLVQRDLYCKQCWIKWYSRPILVTVTKFIDRAVCTNMAGEEVASVDLPVPGGEINLGVVKEELRTWECGMSEQRLAKNGLPYFQSEFEAYYADHWQAEWEQAPPGNRLTLIDPDGRIL